MTTTTATDMKVDHKRMFQARKAKRIIAWINESLPADVSDDLKFEVISSWPESVRERISIDALDGVLCSDETWSIVLGFFA